MISINRASITDVKALSTLFNQYRVFYQQPSDLIACEQFLFERILNEESIVFFAEKEGELLGFTQIYPTFSSISLAKSLILNDLFVIETARGQGIARQLMDAALEYAKSINANGIALETAKDNLQANALYQSLNYESDELFTHYFLKLNTHRM